MPCEIGMGIMPKESKTTKFSWFIHKISKYSMVFYVIVIISLIIFQLDIFKENFPKSYIINGIIVIAMLALGTNAMDKMMRKKADHKPFLYCPECPDAKMRPTGKWVCEQCKQEFGKPRTE